MSHAHLWGQSLRQRELAVQWWKVWEAWGAAWQRGEGKEVKWKVRPHFVGHGVEFGIIDQA